MDWQDRIFTIIHYSLRKELDVSISELVIITLVFQFSKKTGWCYMSKEVMADLIGITRVGLHKAISRIDKLGYIERNKEGYIRLTNDVQGKLEGVNLVDSGSKLSLLTDVNLVTQRCKVTLHNKKRDKEIGTKEEESYMAASPSENASFSQLSNNPLFNNVDTLYAALKHLYGTNYDLSEVKINSLVQAAMGWLITHPKKQRVDHLLFVQSWIDKNADSINNKKKYNENPLDNEEVRQFAELLVSHFLNHTSKWLSKQVNDNNELDYELEDAD